MLSVYIDVRGAITSDDDDDDDIITMEVTFQMLPISAGIASTNNNNNEK